MKEESYSVTAISVLQPDLENINTVKRLVI
jgi:hypothetical protein